MCICEQSVLCEPIYESYFCEYSYVYWVLVCSPLCSLEARCVKSLVCVHRVRTKQIEGKDNNHLLEGWPPE